MRERNVSTMAAFVVAVTAVLFAIGCGPTRAAGAPASAAAASLPATRPLPEAARSRLLAFVASYDTDAFLADSLVRPGLARIMGGDLELLLANLDVRGEVEFASGMVTLSGSAPHRGGLDHGFVGVSVYSGETCAAILTDGRIKLYGAGSDPLSIPIALRDWVLATWAYVTLDARMPPNVEMIEEPPKR